MVRVIKLDLRRRSLLLAAIAMLFTAFSASAQSWTTVGNAGFSAQPINLSYATVTTDRSGNIYVAFADQGNSDKLMVMKFDGSAWDTVGSGVFSAGNFYSPSMAITDNGDI